MSTVWRKEGIGISYRLGMSAPSMSTSDCLCK